ncbi:MAG: FadR/GntR family transcriptional regulator [Trebonia sp.]
MLAPTLPGMTRAEAVAGFVEQLIQTRRLLPGDLIGTKTEIRESVGVAKATMNEAVRLLEARGVLVARPGPGGGLFVAPQDPIVRLGHSLLTVRSEPVSTADAVVVRELLEPTILTDAARHRSEDDIRSLNEQSRALNSSVDSPEEFLRGVWELHRTIARITPNRILSETYLSMLNFIESATRAVSGDAGTAAHRQYKHGRLLLHQRIVRTIIAGDPAATAALAAEHTLGSG